MKNIRLFALHMEDNKSMKISMTSLMNVPPFMLIFRFLIEQSQLVMSDVPTRVKLLGFVLETGDPTQHQQQNEILPNFTIPSSGDSSLPKVDFRIEKIGNRLKLLTEKGTRRYLEDHLDYIDSVVSNLK